MGIKLFCEQWARARRERWPARAREMLQGWEWGRAGGWLEELPCREAREADFPPAPCAKVSLTLAVIQPCGGKCHILMRCESKGEGGTVIVKSSASSTDLLCRPHSLLSYPQFPHLNTNQEQ